MPAPTGNWVVTDNPLPVFVFNSPLPADTSELAIVVATGWGTVAGTTAYSTGVAAFTPTLGFVPGRKYQFSISGATAADGTPMAATALTWTAAAGSVTAAAVAAAYSAIP